jgi:hypothetical protein
MCIKLRKHADEIIAPCIAQCELLEDILSSIAKNVKI